MHKFSFLMRIVLTVVLIAFLLYLAPGETWARLMDTNPALLFTAIAGQFVNIGLGGLRLHRLLGVAIPQSSLSTVLKGTFLGYTVSSVLPSTVGGDIIKVCWLGRRLQNTPAILSSMILERTVSLSFTLLAALVVLVFLLDAGFDRGIMPFSPPDNLAVVALAALALVLFLALAGSVAVRYIRRHRVVLEFIRKTAAALVDWKSHPLRILECLGWSALCSVISASCVLQPLALACGVELLFREAFATMILSGIISLAPFTINGIGVYDASIVGLLMVFGIPTENAVQIALLLRFVTLTVNTPGLVVLLASRAERRTGQLS